MRIGVSGLSLDRRLHQYEFFPQMACNNSYGIPVFRDEVCNYQQEHMPECLNLIQRCYDGERGLCVAATLKCNTLMIVPIKARGLRWWTWVSVQRAHRR